jgi:type VI secretion system protein VasD
MITRRILLGVVAVLSTRCSSPPPPAVLTLNVIGGADQNPDPSGKPAPVAVRLFQLNNPAKFERSDVFALTEREQQTLGSDDQGSEEFVLRPGETRVVTRELKKEVQYLGAVAMFRNIDDPKTRWRAVAPVAASGPTKLTLKISGLTATLT